MLTDAGYIGGFIFYIGATLVALVLFNVWFMPRASLGLRLLISLPIAAVLITPAYIDPEATTFAPALVVSAFRWLSEDLDAAMHSLRPLALFTGLAFAIGVVAFVADALRRRERHDPDHDLSP